MCPRRLLQDPPYCPSIILDGIGQAHLELSWVPSIDQLSYDNYLFFEALHPLLSSTKAFCNSVLSFEGYTFEGYQIAWKSFKKVLLTKLLEAASKLERLHVSQIMDEVLLEATEVVEEAEVMGVKID